MKMEKKILAFDIGGTKIAAAIVGTDGSLRHIAQEPTCQEGPEAGFEQLAAMTEKCLQTAGMKKGDVSGIGIGIAAALETGTDRILWAPNISGWQNVDLRAFLEERFGIPVCLEYDGHAAVLGE